MYPHKKLRGPGSRAAPYGPCVSGSVSRGVRLAVPTKATLAGATPEVGTTFELSGRHWTVTDHSSYTAPDGYNVDEWECSGGAGASPGELAYLLRESDTEVRWYFTRPIPLAAVTLSGGKPFADVATTLTEPPDALVYRGLAHGLDETTDGQYAEDPGESVQKTTWDYWDARHELNLAVERWADGRVECYHGRLIDPARIEVARGGASTRRLGPHAGAAFGAFFGFFVVLVFAGTVEIALTSGLVLGLLVALFASLRGARRVAGGWLAGVAVLGAAFVWLPPLTTLGGLALLLLVPATLTRWIAMGTPGPGAAPVHAALASVATATAGAGLYTYYAFAPVPRSFGQYVLAIGPAAIGGVAAAVVAWVVMRMSAR